MLACLPQAQPQAALTQRSGARPILCQRHGPHPLSGVGCGTGASSGCTSHQWRSHEHADAQALQISLSEIPAEPIRWHEASSPPQPPGPLPVLLLILMLVTLMSLSPGCLAPGTSEGEAEGGERPQLTPVASPPRAGGSGGWGLAEHYGSAPTRSDELRINQFWPTCGKSSFYKKGRSFCACINSW